MFVDLCVAWQTVCIGIIAMTWNDSIQIHVTNASIQFQ